ncbi:uncharacterized protein TNCV_1906181 [Trichonephila clavipes]|nr:uncharacterized protein TNCV_1906181 [Trichonephila clavipes]
MQNVSVHIWATRLDDERLVHPEHFPTVAYLEMKRVRNPRSEGKRIFRNLMDFPPLDNIEVASDMVDASSDTSDNMQMSFEASDNTTSDEVDDSSNKANNEASSDILHADNMELDNMQSSSDNVASDNMQSSLDNGASDNMASDTLTSDNVASDTMTSDNVNSDTMT